MDILIPTDASKGATRGIERGLASATPGEDHVHLLYVVDTRRTGGPTTGIGCEELFLEKYEEEGREHLEAIVDEAERRGIDASIACARGVPADSILEYAHEHDVDRIVMGIHGTVARDSPPRYSTTSEVMENAECAVEAV